MPKDTFYNLMEDKRIRIMDAAMDEFENNTYQEASVNRIVSRAGISKGSFYQYFEDKEDLYQWIIENMVQKKLQYVTQAASNPMDHGFFELLRDMYQAGLEFANDNPRYMNIGNKLLGDTSSPLYQEIVKNNMHRSRAIYGQLIKQGIERGEIKSDINIPLIVQIISDMNLSFIEFYRQNISTEFDESMMEPLDGMIKFLKEGIGAAR